MVFFSVFVGKFHKVLFLAPGGRTVFLGTVPEAENYFERLGYQKPEKVNPADFYMDVIGGVCESSDESLGTLPERWEQYAAENNTGTESTDRADGDESSLVATEDDEIKEVSFITSTLRLIKRNQNRGMQFLPGILIKWSQLHFLTFPYKRLV